MEKDRRLSDPLGYLADIIKAEPGQSQHRMAADLFACTLGTIHGRMAARAYAYSIAPVDPKVAEHILDIVGREG